MNIAALALLLVLSALLFGSMRNESPTTDEPLHLTRGLAWYWGSDTSLSYAHPPLGNLLAAAPVALFEPDVAMARLPGYGRGSVEAVAQGLLGDHYEDRRHWFFWARAVVALLSVLMAAHVFLVSSQLWGATTALLCLGFVCLHPTLIAHGRLVTTDMAVTVFMTAALLELTLFLGGRSARRLLASALCVGCAVATKYTALALLPMFTGLLVGAAVLRAGRYDNGPRARNVLRASAAACLLGLVTLCVVNASYRFERSGLTVAEILAAPEPQNPITRVYRGRLLERETPLASVPGWLPIPLPYSFVLGLASVKAHAREGHGSAFFGEYRRKGSPWYFPVLLLIKTPLTLLLALSFGAAWSLRRRRAPSLPALILTLYGLLLLLMAVQTPINIGVRHVLPLMPALAMLAGRSLAHALHALRPRPLAPYAGALATLQLASLAWCFPDYLSDFNVLVLGRQYGQKVSIVGEEWGQDMVRLGRELEARGITRIGYQGDSLATAPELARFGVSIEPARCGRTVRPAGYVAVNARDLARDLRHCFAWTRHEAPLFDVLGHVFVYGPASRKADRSSLSGSP